MSLEKEAGVIQCRACGKEFGFYMWIKKVLVAVNSAAERSYPMSEVRVSSLECQAATAQEWPSGATQRPRSMVAGRSYPASKVRGSGLECQAAMAQEWPREATPRPRSGAARRSHLVPEPRGCSWEEPPMPEARAGGREEQPQEQWLRGCRRA